MSLFSKVFNFQVGPKDTVGDVGELFPFPFYQDNFINIDVQNLYTRILTDVLERTQGLKEDQASLLWDNCVANETSDGLVTLVAKAMSTKSELFIVYRPDLKLVRVADSKEQAQIKADYKARGESTVGVYITFKNYTRTDMLRLYASLEYFTVSALFKGMNISKSIQLKMSDLRGSVSYEDSEKAIAQAVALAAGLKTGKDILLDAKDGIEMAKPDLTATKSSMDFINEKRALYSAMPASYITGVSAKGLGDSGNADARLIERGLKNYYFAIMKPLIEALFGVKTTFESEDFQQISSALETLKTFELTSEEFLSAESKLGIVNKVFGLPEDTKGGPVEVTYQVTVPDRASPAPAV